MRTKMKKRCYRMYKDTRKNLIIIFLTAVAIVLGLLFYCVKTEAADFEMPEAGFGEFIQEIEVEPIYQEYIDPVYILTDREVDLLLRIGTLEGGCDGVDGIANVMQVVMNRVASDEFPNTVEEVIFQKNPTQFTTADKLATANITSEAYAALDQVIFGDYLWNNNHFFESAPGLIFANMYEYTFTVGGHDFYRLRGGTNEYRSDEELYCSASEIQELAELDSEGYENVGESGSCYLQSIQETGLQEDREGNEVSEEGQPELSSDEYVRVYGGD